MSLQEKLKVYIKENGIKKMHIAGLLGIYPTQLSLWLTERYNLNARQTQIIEDLVSDIKS